MLRHWGIDRIVESFRGTPETNKKPYVNYTLIYWCFLKLGFTVSKINYIVNFWTYRYVSLPESYTRPFLAVRCGCLTPRSLANIRFSIKKQIPPRSGHEVIPSYFSLHCSSFLWKFYSFLPAFPLLDWPVRICLLVPVVCLFLVFSVQNILRTFCVLWVWALSPSHYYWCFDLYFLSFWNLIFVGSV